MAFLFKRNPKNPPELIRALNDQLSKLDYTNDPSSYKKYQDESSRYLKQIKNIIYGDDENEPQFDQINQLLSEILITNNLYILTINLNKLDFDSRKDVIIIYSTLLRRNYITGINGNGNGIGGLKSMLSSSSSTTLSQQSPPVVDYLLHKKPEILNILIRGPETPEIGLVCGQILRDCCKFEEINKYIIYNEAFWNFFKYVENPMFEIACDSMMTLNDLLTIHKKIIPDFLVLNYENFMNHINNLIKSNNYVTKRQISKLLKDLVSERSNLQFLQKYCNDYKNLKYTMLLLSEKSKNLQLEGFHLLKYIIANPKRLPKINETLIKNKQNFSEFFKTFDITSFHDSSLIEERNFIIQQIELLPDKNITQ
ncbi:HYM1 [Candida pseudojiufengensis]|uniref:HYM1 n=1 Tax=Candida pseudojiufengensis TaxID=497109 RepID=UPI002224B8DF|nr:HYM1 [Candida pseudojiufengensis]KAI5960557.1 HYM1 [Candida pseudojiufengensis]